MPSSGTGRLAKRVIDQVARHGPKPPGRSDGIDLPAPAVGILAARRSSRGSAATRATGAGSCAGAAARARRACRSGAPSSPPSRDGRASPTAPRCEQPRALVVRHVGRRPVRGHAVEVHEARARGRARAWIRCVPIEPPLLCPIRINGSARTESSTAQHVAHVGVPAVELGVLRVAVAALVPRHHAVAARRRAAARRRRRCRRSRSRRARAGSRGAEASPHSDTARRSPCAETKRWRSGRRAPGWRLAAASSGVSGAVTRLLSLGRPHV